jgi:methyl-accepting chemotaxis protein
MSLFRSPLFTATSGLWAAIVALAVTLMTALTTGASWLVVVPVVLALGGAILVMWGLRGTVTAMNQCRQMLDNAARGNLEDRFLLINGHDALAELARAINHFMDSSDAFVRESEASLSVVAQNRFYRRIVERGMNGTFKAAATTINTMTRNLQTEIQSHRQIAREFQEVVSTQVGVGNTIARQTKSNAQEMESASNDTLTMSRTVYETTLNVSRNMQTVAVAADKLTASIGEIRSRIGHAENISGSAVKTVSDTQSVVTALADAAQKIGAVVSLINDVASQTNLLALNATIEAARAGEAGKGFAVVANEVKTLANQTAKATDEIRIQVDAIRSISTAAVDAMNQIGSTVQQINEISAAVSQAINDQSVATREISSSTNSSAGDINDTASKMEDVTAAATRSADAARRVLKDSVDMNANSEKLAHEVTTFIGRMT